MPTMYERIMDMAKEKRNKGVPSTMPPRTAPPSDIMSPEEAFQRGLPGYTRRPEGATDQNHNPMAPTVKKVAQAESVDPATKAQRQLAQEQEDTEKRRLRGRASTLVTGSRGLLDSPSTSRRTLIGY